jgi:peptidoglycan hydrolase CwlO-like protein
MKFLIKLPIIVFILLSVKCLIIPATMNDILLASVLGLISGFFHKEDKDKQIKDIKDQILKNKEDIESLRKDISTTKTDVTSLKMFKR